MSETPETDRECGQAMWLGSGPLVSCEFARRLERERDEAREQLRLANIDCLAALTELDALRAALQQITECDMRWSKKIARDALENAK